MFRLLFRVEVGRRNSERGEDVGSTCPALRVVVGGGSSHWEIPIAAPSGSRSRSARCRVLSQRGLAFFSRLSRSARGGKELHPAVEPWPVGCIVDAMEFSVEVGDA